MTITKQAMWFAAFMGTAVAALAQSEAPKASISQFYRFDFVLKELDGSKAVKTHNYQMMVTPNYQGRDSIRSGARVPVVDAKGTNYIDVGVNLDVGRLTPSKDGLEFDIVAEVSGVLESGAQLSKQPMVYQTKWNSRVEIQIGKPTTVFSSDDPSSKHQLQLEVTATPIH
jgi:hypothetical protein